jgi:hypothetical protein
MEIMVSNRELFSEYLDNLYSELDSQLKEPQRDTYFQQTSYQKAAVLQIRRYFLYEMPNDEDIYAILDGFKKFIEPRIYVESSNHHRMYSIAHDMACYIEDHFLLHTS